MGNNMNYPLPQTLSVLLDKNAQNTGSSGLDNIPDAHLRHARYEDALSGYEQLDVTTPLLIVKIAFCEWRLGRYEDARNRLLDLGEDLDVEGIGLLSMLVTSDRDYKRSSADRSLIWPKLKRAISSDSVPLLAAIARASSWWPGDHETPHQRLNDLQYLLSLYPWSQKIRLAVLTCMQRCEIPLCEQYALITTPEYPPQMPCLLWYAAEIAVNVEKNSDALEFLRQLEEIEKNYEPTSDEILLEIELARSDIQVKIDPKEGFLSFECLLNNASLSTEIRLRITRAALAIACRDSKERVPEFAEEFFNLLEAKQSSFYINSLDFYDDEFPISGSNWENFGRAWSCSDLRPYQNILTNLANKRTQLFYRMAYAILKLDEVCDELEDDEPNTPEGFWLQLAELVGDISGYEHAFDGRLLSLCTAIESQCQDPDWNTIGQNWILSEWIANQKEIDFSYNELTLGKASKHTGALKKFTTGVIRQLKALEVPAPKIYDLIKELVSVLVKHDIKSEFYQLMGLVAHDDNRSSVQFYLGLSSHVMKYHTKAKTSYQNAINLTPNHYSAIFNILLLCTSQADMPLVEKVKSTVLNYQSDSESERKELEDALHRALKRCEDKEGAKRRTIIAELNKLPVLVEYPVDVSDITLRAAVALLALFRCSNAEPGDTELPMLSQCETPFGPMASNNAILFDLLKTGLVAVHPETKLDAFVVESDSDSIRAWRFGRIRWRLSPSCAFVVEQLRAINGNIPNEWVKEVYPLALEIARAEVTQYIGFLALERNWPEPRNTEDVSDLTRELVNELPVSQTFHLAYLGAMSASDYKQKYPVSGQQAADMLVKRTGQRLESIRSGKFPSKAYDRPWKLPRSAISLALWGTLLDKGDQGFTDKIADLIKSL
ncbi:hypothetical protein [Serratia plymuthica]